MTSERVLDLYAAWEEALSYPEPNLEIVASLEADALNEGIDLREVNYVLVHGLTAAVWNPDLHPRGRDGRFIEVLGFIQLFDFDGPDGSRGQVKEIRPGKVRGNPDIDVELDDGRTVTVKPNQITSAPDVKANLGRDRGPSQLVEAEGLEEAFNVGIPKSIAEGFERYRLDQESRGEDVLDLDDWVRAGQPGPGPRKSLFKKLDPDGDILQQYKDGALFSSTGADDYGREAARLMSDDELDEAISFKETQLLNNVGMSPFYDLRVLTNEKQRRGGPEVVPEGRPFEDLDDADLQTRYAESVDQMIGDVPEDQMADLELENTLLREELDRRGISRTKAPGPETVPEGRPFENLSDAELQTRYAESVDRMVSDIPEDEMADAELENTLLREEQDRRGIQRWSERRQVPPYDRTDPESVRVSIQEDMDGSEPIDQDVILREIDELEQEDARQLLQELIDANQDHGRLDVLEDALYAIQPAAPAEPRVYNEGRDVGNLMVGDEIIMPGDIPGIVEDFEFVDGDPGRVTIRTDNGSYFGRTTDILPSFREGEDEGLSPVEAGANTNQIGEEISVEPGEPGSRENPIQTSDVLEAVTALHEGKYVELESVEQVSTLLDELARIANEAKAAGADAPNYDLCLVSVPDTNLFCAESKGIPRIEMPQLSGIPVPGSPADALPKNSDGEVNIGPAFADYLRNKGITVTEKRRPASHLKASQNELVGAKVAGMMKWLEGDTETARNVIREGSIFTTSDDYVVDGHHRWAAVVGLDAAEGGLDDLDMPVQEIDLPILDVLKEANDFATSYGVPPKGAGAGADVGGAPGGAGTAA